MPGIIDRFKRAEAARERADAAASSSSSGDAACNGVRAYGCRRPLGFWQAAEAPWPARGQRCWVDKTANDLNKLPKSKQPKAKRALQEIWMGPSPPRPTSWPPTSPTRPYCGGAMGRPDLDLADGGSIDRAVAAICGSWRCCRAIAPWTTITPVAVAVRG